MFDPLLVPRVNPLGQIAGMLLLLVPPLLSFDPWTPLVALAASLPLLIVWLRPSWRTWRPLAAPIVLLAAGLFVMNLLFTEPGAGARTLWSWGWLSVNSRSWARAWAVFDRSAVLSVVSTLTACAFGPLPLVRALMQQAGMSPLWGYSLYAGLNVLPSLVDDLKTLKDTRRIRTGRRQSWAEALSLPLILLAGAIRRAERISLSMAGRELETAEHRTFVVVSTWRWTDTAYVVVCALAAGLVLAIAVVARFFQFNLG